MGNEEFHIAGCLRLGLPISGSTGYCALCKEWIDNRGIHHFACKHQRSSLLDKHDKLCRELILLAHLAGVNAKDRHLTVFKQLDPDNHLRPDILMPGMGDGGSDLLIDLTLTDPRNSSNVGRSAVTRHAAIKRKVNEKNNKYRDPLHLLGHSFLAAAAEIFGCMAKEFYALIKALVKRASTRSLIPESTLLPYWTKRLSMVIQRGNAKFWLNANARMCGAPCLHELSVDDATSQLYNVVD